MPASPVRIVLLRPRNPENLGAVARAMKNFGLSDWAIAELGTHDFSAMRRVAVHSEELLDRPRLVRTLDEAVSDCAWVVGTSSRRVRGKRLLSPEEVATEAVSRAGEGRTAIVFGDERSGLTNAEVLRCHDLSVIPTEAEQPSLNLAQAVLVFAYELRRVLRRSAGDAIGASRAAGATDADLTRIEDSLRGALRGGGFLRGPERHAVRDLMDALRRARLGRREARLWETALKALASPLPPQGRGPRR